MNKKENRIQGNLSNRTEVLNLTGKFPQIKDFLKIKESNKKYFCFLGFNMKQSGMMSVDLNIKEFTKSVEDWNRMTEYNKTPKNIGNFNNYIMIHNPMIQEAIEEKPSFVNLTKSRKTKVLNYLESEGKTEENILKISNDLNLNPEQVKEYIESV
jgi:predicted transcriptional regulator YheO